MFVQKEDSGWYLGDFLEMQELIKNTKGGIENP